MNLAITAFMQIMIMFFIILAGIVCYKTKLIDNEMNKKLADLVLVLVNPILIFVSYQREFQANLLSGLLISFLMATITHFFAIFTARFLVRKKNNKPDLTIERFAIIYSNCGFIGIPLVNGILGSEGVFYLTAYMTIFNLFIWTHGMITMSGRTDKKMIMKALLSPSILATIGGFLFFVCKIMLPNVMIEALSYLGDMNTPLAMLVSGVTIAQTDLIKLFRKIKIFYLTFLKLIFIPVAMLFLFHLFDMERIVLLTSILAAACPTAASVNLFALKYDKNYLYASELFAVTTILSIITIPLVMIVANLLIT
ncbi:MAG: putative rane protein [Herbinix sp.]|jgi:predicted permease|nr:putative rane protein [Herbinix sp.]